MSENTGAVEELILSQEDATGPENHKTVRHSLHKNDNIVNLTFPYWKLLFFDTSYYLHIFQKLCCEFCRNLQH